MSAIRRIVYLTALLSTTVSLFAQSFEFYPGAQYDPAIPALKKIAGHDWAGRITMHYEAERYLQALTQATPLVQLVRYGETWEGRALYYLIVTSAENMGRVAEIKSSMQRLADPRTLAASEAEEVIKKLPAITWLTYGVHGNEISSTDAALLFAYHLAAAQKDSLTQKILKQSVVIIDPMENPDGRDRYITYLRQTQGRWPDADPQAAEHNELWPSGRSNHYLFDMNRDWFANTQPETRGRTRIFLEWYPQVFVDLHEMGYNQTYYFAPPAAPLNPNLTTAQQDWLTRYGRNNAKWFDRFRFDYFTREIFDSFYPGYGEGWPIFQGAIGMTYEQAGSDGLLIRRNDETVLHYRDAVQHHFIASLATAEMAANHRAEMLRYFYDYRRTAIEEGAQETIKEYIIPPGNDPGRAAKLAGLLLQQGLEVKRAEEAFTHPRARDYYERKLQSKNFPEGTFVVALAQPAKRLLKTLMDRHTDMDSSFIKQQRQRLDKRQSDEIYDVTGWSLPLLYGVECYAAEQISSGKITVLAQAPHLAGKVLGGKAHVGYLIAWGKNNAAAALADLLQQKIRVHTIDKEIKHERGAFARGTLLVKVKDNPEDLFERLQKLAAAYGIEIHAAGDSWVAAGVNFGSDYVKYLKPPKIAMAYNFPASSLSAGWARYVLEQMYGYPVTAIHTWQLESADLKNYNVIILPDGTGAFGGYSKMLGESGAQKLKSWMQNGGTLVTFGDATRWLTEEKVNLLATSRELRGGKPERKSDKDKKEESPAPLAGAYNLQQNIQPEEELPERIPGAILRLQLENTHWMTAGYDGFANVMVESNNIFTPLKLDKGVNLGVYLAEDKVVASGFVWEASRKQIAHKAGLMYQPHGGGQVIAFAEDPNYRAFMDGLNLLFLNAVFFGPAHAQ